LTGKSVKAEGQPRRVLISVNPRAGARSGRPKVEKLAAHLRDCDFAVDVLDDIECVAQISEQSLRDGELRAVVAAGGDGTAALIANRTKPGTPIALLPLGTENLLSKYFGVSTDPLLVRETIDQGATVRLDAGRAGERIFLLMVGCGLDAEVVRRTHAMRTGHIHQLSYAKPLLDSIYRYQYPTIRVRYEGRNGSNETGEINAAWAFVVNLPRYAMGLSFAPQAVGTDGMLDVCTFRHGSLWRGLWYLGHVMAGRHPSLGDCTSARACRVRIEADADVPYQLDGDPGGFLPLDIEVLPQRLTMLVPADWARRHLPAQEAPRVR